MIAVFERDATSFTSNGLGLLRPSRCEVSEAVNGEFVLELEHPTDDDGIWRLLTEERILRASTPRGDQPFRIYRIDKLLSGTAAVYARHLSYDLLGALIENKAPTDATAAQALLSALDGTAFSGSSDVPGTNSVRWVRKNVIAAVLGSDENSILSRWGGEAERDGYSLNLLQRLGADRGVSIRYRKNLTGLEAVTDLSGVVTRVLPTGLREDGQTVLELPEKFVDSPLIGSYRAPVAAHRHYGDIKIGEDFPTEEDAYAALRAAVNAEYAAGLDKPAVTLSVSFLDLAQTLEYARYAVLERVYLGDTVHVTHEGLGIETAVRCVSYKWDVLRNRYIEVLLGQPAGTITAAINEQTQKIPELAANQTALQAAVASATAMLGNPGSSYVRFSPSISNPAEIYVMDTEDTATAQSVMRLNSAGLGISNTGINGPYITAATGAGINAEAITAGVIKAAIVFAGILQGASGTFADLVAGIAEAQRMHLGSDAYGDPYARFYDEDNELQLELGKRGIDFKNGARFVKAEVGTRTGVGVYTE